MLVISIIADVVLLIALYMIYSLIVVNVNKEQKVDLVDNDTINRKILAAIYNECNETTDPLTHKVSKMGLMVVFNLNPMQLQKYLDDLISVKILLYDPTDPGYIMITQFGIDFYQNYVQNL